MTGLLKKDFIMVGKNSKINLFIVALFFVISLIAGENDLMSAMIIIMLSMLVVYTFTLDAASKWERYVLALPVTRKDVVLSKYIIALLLTGIGAGITAFLKIASAFIQHRFTGWGTWYIFFVLSVLFLCLLLPLIFKFGAEKSQMLAFVAYGLPIVAVVLVMTFTGVTFNENTFSFLFQISPLILLAGIFISYGISCRIYRNAEL